MANNKLANLNEHLFAQLERLNDETITSPEAIEMEIKKSKAMSGIAGQIIKTASLTLQAAKMVSEGQFTEDVTKDVKTKFIEGKKDA